MPTYENEDLATPGLDDFLKSSGANTRLQGQALHQRIRALLEADTDHGDRSKPLPQDHSQRILACWRIARAMARIAGYTAEDETLDATLSNIEPDPWFIGIEYKTARVQQQLLRQSTVNEMRPSFESGQIPLLPPPPNRIEDPTTGPKAAERWCQIAETLAIDLNFYSSDIGQRGIHQMLDPETARYHNVTPNQILLLEELLVDEAQNLIIKVGERPAIQKFRQTYGFTRAEALGLMRLARAEALRMDGSSVDENRAIMSSQLKDFIARTKQSLNQRDELSALKELGRVQGLTRTEPEDAAREFYNSVAKISQQHDQNALERLPLRLVEAKVVNDNEDDDDDPEALKAFDRENLP